MIVLLGASLRILLCLLFGLVDAALLFFLKLSFAHEVVTDSELVTHDYMSKTYTLLSLLIGVFVLVKL